MGPTVRVPGLAGLLVATLMFVSGLAVDAVPKIAQLRGAGGLIQPGRVADLEPAHGRSLKQHHGAHYHNVLVAHGWMAALSLGVLIPAGIVISKASSHTRAWKYGFWLHVPCQVLGLLGGIVGTALGSQLEVEGELLRAHKGIGIAAVCAVAVQAVIAISWRPPPKSAKRWIFQSYHWWLGRMAACLGIINVFLGLRSQAPKLIHYVIAYAVVIGLFILLWTAAALIKWRFEPVFIPKKYQPMGKEGHAEYEGTELGPANGQHGNGHNGYADGGYANGDSGTKQSLA